LNTADFRKPERSAKSDAWPRWVAAGLLALALSTAASWTLLQQYTSRALSHGLDRSLADAVDRVVASVEARGALAATIADRPEMHLLLRELADRPDDPALRARLRNELRRFSAHGFGAIELLAADGRPLAAIGELDRQPRPSLPVLSPYDMALRWTPESIVLRFRQRIGDERGPLAELVADQPLSRLRAVAENEPWLQLCRPVDGDLECLPDRDGHTLQRIPSSQLPAQLRRQLASERALPEGDPALVSGHVAYEPIAELGLVAALDIDRVARYAPLRNAFQVSVLGLILMMGGGGWLLRRQLEPLSSRLLAAQAYATDKAAELRSCEALLRVIYEEAPHGIALLDTDRRIVMANARAAQLFGYPSLVGMHAEQLRPVEERMQRARLLDRAFGLHEPDQRPATYSVNGLCRDGRVIPLDVVPSPIELDGRRMIMMMVSDVTERRRAELSLRESEQRFRNTMEHAPIGMALIALSGHWLEVNAAVCSMTGYSAQELRRLRFQDITHRDDLVADLDQLSQLVEGRISSYQLEKRYIHRQGHVIWALLAVSLVRDADGKPLHFIAQIKDADERLRLRSALAMQSAIVDSAHASIIGVDANGLIVSFNKAAQRLLGYREEEVVGRMRAEALHDEQEMMAHAASLTERFGRRVDSGFDALTAYLRVHDADHREWLYVRKDGARVPVLLSSTALYDDNGRITGFLGIASDISQQKRNESELKAALEEKETLLREVYHRVKNNLQVVGSLFSLQLRSLPPGPAHAALADAADRVRTMALLHEKLYRSPTLSAIDLDDYFGDLLHRIAVSSGAAERGIDVQSHCVRLQIGLDTAVPLGLIANELVGNALKHAFPNARSGRVRLRVEIDGDSIVLTVDDDGVGLPADGRHLSSASLGLVLVRSLSSQLDADFTLESGAGTRARLRLSRSRGSIAPETDFGASHRKKGPASGAGEQ
jgi:PAS domain S-box-containing protein